MLDTPVPLTVFGSQWAAAEHRTCDVGAHQLTGRIPQSGVQNAYIHSWCMMHCISTQLTEPEAVRLMSCCVTAVGYEFFCSKPGTACSEWFLWHMCLCRLTVGDAVAEGGVCDLVFPCAWCPVLIHAKHELHACVLELLTAVVIILLECPGIMILLNVNCMQQSLGVLPCWQAHLCIVSRTEST